MLKIYKTCISTCMYMYMQGKKSEVMKVLNNYIEREKSSGIRFKLDPHLYLLFIQVVLRGVIITSY